MVTLLLDSTQLEIVLSPVEKLLAFRRTPLRVERSRIAKIQLTDDAWTWLRGIPKPGMYVRGVVAMGTWRSTAEVDFVVVRRARPAVVIDLEDADEFRRLVITTRHGLALVQALRLDADDAPADVADIVAPPGDAPEVSRRARARRARARRAGAPGPRSEPDAPGTTPLPAGA